MEALRQALIRGARGIALALLASASATSSACTPPSLPPACQASTNCGALGEVTVCCTLSSCEYHVQSTVFPCAGTDCTAAHRAVADYCAPHCPDAGASDDAASSDAGPDAALDTGPSLDAQPCVR